VNSYVTEESIEDGVQYTASILSPVIVGRVYMCIYVYLWRVECGEC